MCRAALLFRLLSDLSRPLSTGAAIFEIRAHRSRHTTVPSIIHWELYSDFAYVNAQFCVKTFNCGASRDDG